MIKFKNSNYYLHAAIKIISYLIACFIIIQPLYSEDNTFLHQSLPKNIKKIIYGRSWKAEGPIELKNLSYLRITYWGFDNLPHTGELIVNKELAEEILTIFRELYE